MLAGINESMASALVTCNASCEISNSERLLWNRAIQLLNMNPYRAGCGQQPSWGRLPSGLMDVIVGRLSTNDVRALQGTNKLWRTHSRVQTEVSPSSFPQLTSASLLIVSKLSRHRFAATSMLITACARHSVHTLQRSTAAHRGRTSGPMPPWLVNTTHDAAEGSCLVLYIIREGMKTHSGPEFGRLLDSVCKVPQARSALLQLVEASEAAWHADLKRSADCSAVRHLNLSRGLLILAPEDYAAFAADCLHHHRHPWTEAVVRQQPPLMNISDLLQLLSSNSNHLLQHVRMLSITVAKVCAARLFATVSFAAAAATRCQE